MRAPDLVGQGGAVRAWRLRPNRFGRPDHAATVDSWFVTGPFHPAWSWWGVSVVHLRDLPGVPPAKKGYPEAEYEFIIASMDPAAGEPDIEAIEDGRPGVRFLTPLDVVEQFHGVTDCQARGICESAVRAIIAGGASPDQDWREWWRRTITATVAHVRTGAHG